MILIISSFCMTIFDSSIFFETPCILYENLDCQGQHLISKHNMKSLPVPGREQYMKGVIYMSFLAPLGK